jgi:hypothetical protein
MQIYWWRIFGPSPYKNHWWGVCITYVVFSGDISPQHFGFCTLSHRDNYLASSPIPDFHSTRKGKHHHHHRVTQCFFPPCFPSQTISNHDGPVFSTTITDHTTDYVSSTPAKCRSLEISNPTDESTHFSTNDFYDNNTDYVARSYQLRSHFINQITTRGPPIESSTYGSVHVSNLRDFQEWTGFVLFPF